MIEDNLIKAPLTSQGAVIYAWGDEQEGTEEDDSERKKGIRRGFSRECREEMIAQFKAEKGTKFGLHLGDSFDWLRPTMRGRLESQLVHDPSARMQLDKAIRKRQDEALKDLTAFEGRMIGCHEGHHTWKFPEGVTIDQRLALALRAPYLGWIAASRITFDIGKTGHYTLTICSTHGGGGATAVGSDARKIADLAAGTHADVYFRGHSCKAMVLPASERRVIRRAGPPGVIRSVPWYINVPGMCRSYTNGWDSVYAERAGYIPQPLGWCVLRIKVVQRREEEAKRGLTTDFHAKRYSSNSLHLEPSPVIFSDWGVE